MVLERRGPHIASHQLLRGHEWGRGPVFLSTPISDGVNKRGEAGEDIVTENELILRDCFQTLP